MMQPSKQQQQLLRENHLFRALTEQQFDALMQHLSVKKLAQGEQLFAEGDEAGVFYFLLQGKVKLYRLSAAGQEKVVEIISPGQTFAEALMFRAIPAYPVSAQALGETELLAINNKGFMQLLGQSVETCFQLMADLSLRLHGLLDEVEALTLQNAQLRVVNYLLYLAGESGTTFSLPATKSTIASRLSIQPETLSRILGTLSAKGLISVEGLSIEVLKPEQLRTMSTATE
jgi:CRP-like cAMP-binding protein